MCVCVGFRVDRKANSHRARASITQSKLKVTEASGFVGDVAIQFCGKMNSISIWTCIPRYVCVLEVYTQKFRPIEKTLTHFQFVLNCVGRIVQDIIFNFVDSYKVTSKKTQFIHFPVVR